MEWRIERSKAAKDDLLDIWCHIALDNEAAADRVLDRIEARLQRLVDHPRIGRTRDDIFPGLRGASVGSYLIPYRLEDSHSIIQIVRVLHAMRNLRGVFA